MCGWLAVPPHPGTHLCPPVQKGAKESYSLGICPLSLVIVLDLKFIFSNINSHSSSIWFHEIFFIVLHLKPVMSLDVSKCLLKAYRWVI